MHIATRITLGIFIGLNIVGGFLGNLLVIIAVIRERKLHTRANYLIGSLAIADLLVSLLVLPFAAFMSLHDSGASLWFPEKPVCRLFIFLDVTCCTASILHLCVIAWVRYRKVSTIRRHLFPRSFVSVIPTIIAIWLAAVLLSVAPYLLFPGPKKDGKSMDSNSSMLHVGEFRRIFQHNTSMNTAEMEERCIVNNNKVYRVVATTVAFYAPLVVILVIYSKMAKIAWARIHRKPSVASPCSTEEGTAKETPTKNRSFDRVWEQIQWMLQRHSEANETFADRSRADKPGAKNLAKKVSTDNNNVVITPTAERRSEPPCSKPNNFGDISRSFNSADGPCKAQSMGWANDVGDEVAMVPTNKKSTFVQTEKQPDDPVDGFPVFHVEGPSSDEDSLAENRCTGNLLIQFQRNSQLSRLTDIDSVRDASSPNRDILLSTLVPLSFHHDNRRSRSKSTRSLSKTTTTKPEHRSLSLIYRRSQILRESTSEKDGCVFLPYPQEPGRPAGDKDGQVKDIAKVAVSADDAVFSSNPSSPAATDCVPRITRAFHVRGILSLKMKRERKVIRTLGMVIGAFVICWLPFFAKEIILPFCTSCYLSPVAEIFINWLGYANSVLNPFIYAFTNKDFNLAFRRIITGKAERYKYGPNRMPPSVT